MISKEDLVLKYLGVPYKYKGNDLNGFDCWTLVVSIFKDLGYDISYVSPKYNKNYKWEKMDDVNKYADRWLKVDNQRYMDIILFSGKTHHAGFCLDNFRFIQCNKRGVSIVRINKNNSKEIKGFYRLKETINDNC
jgi:cell wall-associated NlpC family hydrolase